jgi:hypothetical protein
MIKYVPLVGTPSLERSELAVIEAAHINELRNVSAVITGRAKRIAQPIRITSRPATALGDDERDRHRRYAEAALRSALDALVAMPADSGRNLAAFRLACRFGRWVHHDILPADRFAADVLAACQSNGLVRDDGERSVLATIKSGLDRSANDTLPDLGAPHE